MLITIQVKSKDQDSKCSVDFEFDHDSTRCSKAEFEHFSTYCMKVVLRSQVEQARIRITNRYGGKVHGLSQTCTWLDSNPNIPEDHLTVIKPTNIWCSSWENNWYGYWEYWLQKTDLIVWHYYFQLVKIYSWTRSIFIYTEKIAAHITRNGSLMLTW